MDSFGPFCVSFIHSLAIGKRVLCSSLLLLYTHGVWHGMAFTFLGRNADDGIALASGLVISQSLFDSIYTVMCVFRLLYFFAFTHALLHLLLLLSFKCFREDGKMCALALATRSLAILSINEMPSKEDPCSQPSHTQHEHVCRNVLEMVKAVESFSMAKDNR